MARCKVYECLRRPPSQQGAVPRYPSHHFDQASNRATSPLARFAIPASWLRIARFESPAIWDSIVPANRARIACESNSFSILYILEIPLKTTSCPCSLVGQGSIVFAIRLRFGCDSIANRTAEQEPFSGAAGGRGKVDLVVTVPPPPATTPPPTPGLQ